jgi:DNA-binding XRE family transcriptional regulator
MDGNKGKIILAITNPMGYINNMTSQELKAWRKKNKYTQVQLSEALHVHAMTISKWETEAREIPPFLYLALKCLKKREGGESKKRDMKKRKEKS